MRVGNSHSRIEIVNVQDLRCGRFSHEKGKISACNQNGTSDKELPAVQTSLQARIDTNKSGDPMRNRRLICT
jgi:hypothetical protein